MTTMDSESTELNQDLPTYFSLRKLNTLNR
jgi:hypothetical protein